MAEIVEQRRQFDPSRDAAVDNLSSNSAPADQQALVDKVLDCSTDRGATEIESFTECDLVLESSTGGKCAVHDGFFNSSFYLEVERNWAVSVEIGEER